MEWDNKALLSFNDFRGAVIWLNETRLQEEFIRIYRQHVGGDEADIFLAGILRYEGMQIWQGLPDTKRVDGVQTFLMGERLAARRRQENLANLMELL